MKLWEPKGCCCFSLRTGTIIIGVFFLITGCSNLLGVIKNIATSQLFAAETSTSDNDLRQFCREIGLASNCTDWLWNFVVGCIVVSILVALIHITFSALLIHGVLKQKSRFLVPIMIMYLIQIVIIVIIALVIIGLFLYLQVWVAVILLVIVFGLMIFLETYFLLVIRAYYYDVKRNKGQVHMSLNEQGYAPTPYNDPGKPATQY